MALPWIVPGKLGADGDATYPKESLFYLPWWQEGPKKRMKKGILTKLRDLQQFKNTFNSDKNKSNKKEILNTFFRIGLCN